MAYAFDKLSNFRDLGGLATGDGGALKSGVLFRSDDPSRITQRDLAKLHELGIKLICDLRSPNDSQRRPRTSSIEIANVPLVDRDANRTELLGFLFGKTGGERFRTFTRDYYRHIAFDRTARLRELLTRLANARSLPALIHCSAGKDRTGFVAAVIQLLAGVPYETVKTEYLRTNEQFAPRLDRFIKVLRVATLFRVSEARMREVMMAQPEHLDDIHAAIVERHGSIESYLRDACKLEPSTLQQLKQHLLA
ncbi:MAG TPA: tyrosine-protein phosphatase [Kofleriaceae bacterium]